MWLSLFLLSPFELSAQRALWVLLGQANDSLGDQVMHSLRLPRVMAALVIGASLAVAGALMQAVTRNALASPGILGVNAGACAAIVIVGGFLPAAKNGVSLSLIAALGGGLAWALVMLIGFRKNGLSTGRLVLAGISVSAFCMAVTKAALILFEDNAYSVMRWLAGGVGNVRAPEALLLAAFCLPTLLVVLLLSARVNLLALSDDAARSLGVGLLRLRLLLCVLVLLLTGACVSVAGPIAFLALMVPHIARLLFGFDARVLLPAAALLGALFMLAADLLARYLVFPEEMPAGAVIAIVGAPFFIVLSARLKGG